MDDQEMIQKGCAGVAYGCNGLTAFLLQYRPDHSILENASDLIKGHGFLGEALCHPCLHPRIVPMVENLFKVSAS
jgi:hypothetical protein